MASSSSSLGSPQLNEQKGWFTVSFDSKTKRDFFSDHFAETQTYFSLSGLLTLIPQTSFSIVKGTYLALEHVEVLKALQFVVNKTFIPTLTALDHGAFHSGTSAGSVSATTPTVLKDDDGDDVAKRAEIALSKTIIVNASGLDRDVSVLFTFVDPKNDQLFNTQFPTAWRVAYFSKGLNNTFSATYSTQLAIGAIQFVNGTIIIPTVWTDASPGDIWKLSFVNSAYRLEKTKAGDPTQAFAPINVVNNTGSTGPIAVGFDATGSFNIALTQKSVGNGQAARFSFAPIVNAWVISDYSQNEVVSSEILSPPLFGPTGLNLLTLTPVTTFKFTQNPDGSYAIAQL